MDKLKQVSLVRFGKSLTIIIDRFFPQKVVSKMSKTYDTLYPPTNVFVENCGRQNKKELFILK